MQSEIFDVLRGLLDHVDRNTCTHESTHRGGFLWTICDDCGMKWADDKGGFKPHADAPAVAKARAALTAALSEQGRAVEVKVKPLEWREDRTAKALGATWMVWHYSDPLKDGLGQWLWQVVDAAPHASGRYHTEAEAKAAAQSDYEQRIRSALVDVPVEPENKADCQLLRMAVAAVLEADTEFRAQLPKGWEGDPLSDEIDGLRRIFDAHPPLSHRGEGSAGMIAKARALALAILANYSGMEDGNGDEAPELAMARDLIAATRSGSATTAKGCAE